MAAVANVAKVSAGTLYLHFASKEDMLQKVYLELKRELYSEFMTAAEPSDQRESIAGIAIR